MENSLTRFALKGLNNCWSPEQHCWSHIYHLDGRAEPNESLPTSDPFYSMNVLLSFARLSDRLESYRGVALTDVFHANAERIVARATPTYAKGMLFWAAAENGFDIPAEIERAARAAVTAKVDAGDLSAQDAGMILAGCASMADRDPAYRALADRVYALQRARLAHESHLYFDHTKKLRRAFSSFATHTYSTLGLFLYGEAFGVEEAIAKAVASARKLISLQGPQGEWPWFYYTPGGRIVDMYEVYSVHQDGMAPAFLHHAERHGVAEARPALERGFHWILNQNELSRPMFWPETGMITRSVVRKGELTNSRSRMLRALGRAALGGAGDELLGADGVELRLECRSYHLGWVVWSFAGRDDYAALVEHPAFAEAAPAPQMDGSAA